MSTALKRMTHATAESPDRTATSPAAADKEQLRQRLLEMIVKREAQRRAGSRAAG